MGFEFDERSSRAFEELLRRYPEPAAALLPAFRLVERQQGRVDEEAVGYVADRLKVSRAAAQGAFTFYTHFRRTGDGKYVIQVCRTLSCALRGARGLIEHLEATRKIGVGGTTPDGKFTLKEVECLGACGGAPAVQIDDRCFERLTPSELDRILDGLE